MAEIVRTETRIESCQTRVGDNPEPPTTINELRTVVRSIHGGDANVLRDFVAALDSAAAPGTVPVEARRSSDGQLIGLAAEWTSQPDVA